MRIKWFRVLLVAGFYWITDESIVEVHFDIFILYLNRVLVQKIQLWFQYDLPWLTFRCQASVLSGLQLMMNWFNSLRALRIKEFSNIDATLKYKSNLQVF